MNDNKEWIDISQPLTNDIAHWPGDEPFSYQLTFSKDQTGSVNIGQFSSSCHTGTHIDAPFHFDNKGKKVNDLDITIYIGPAKIIDVSGKNSIDAEYLASFAIDRVERLLLHTSLPNDPTRFPGEMPVLDPNIAPFLADKGVRLLGVDMPSVDSAESKDLQVHHALNTEGIHILENLMLDQVACGDYELIALPLALQDADGSPVRAVIRRL
ncbi:arylformamidase [Sediminibacillus albus]|uniref:Kynurenine formamidase n=1 Tax=Sediminibacillus albus TaxID=407036 RepID=A0A1G8WKP8_9BACI|nr:arylformamidase [Sediminibacillus albus]SDJ78170.1 arylformamidase [Sediminibacillus albus]